MGKFRSKLKGGAKGKRWAKGQSSSSNPETQKHRNAAKSRFFQENLGQSNLTSDALRKHDVVQSLSHKPEESDMKESDAEVESSVETSTYETMDSFASEWSHCSNMSFKRFFTIFRANSALHKEMLAVLAAITEVIKEKGGSETPTEYYCALVTALEQVISVDPINEDQVTAILALLNMGIKSVPNGVLQTSFDVCKKMITILNKFSVANNNVIVKSAFGVLTALLVAQDGAIWSLSSTLQVFNVILNPFCIHHKPKWRKPAQNAASLIAKTNSLSKEGDSNRAANRVAEFCKETIDECLKSNSSIKSSQTTILHVLGLMKDTIGCYSKANIKKSCELILQLMTLNYPLVKSCGLQVIHSLFSLQTAVVPAKLNGQIISALYEYQPSLMDVQITLAWVTVMQQAHVHLADVDLSLACAALPKIFESLTQLWLSEKKEVPTAATHALEALLRDAILPVCDNSDLIHQHLSKLEKCFDLIELGLGYQYNMVWNQVLHVISVMFEVAGKNGSNLLLGCLKSLAELRDSYKFSYNNELENAVGAAVKSMGPEVVLQVITLTKDSQEINLDRSWLLPVLKENIKSATLDYWIKTILPLATFCHQHSVQLASRNEGINAHVYELLHIQLWSLLPSFCNKAADIKESFKGIAKILGVGISEHKDLRLSIMASLRKLIVYSKENENKEDLAEIARFDKNYLPILFNLYTTKAKDGEEEGHRLAALETIKVFLTVSKPELVQQLFDSALERLQGTEGVDADSLYLKEAIMDLIRELVPYQNHESIEKLYLSSVKPIPKMTNKKEQQKAFRLLEEIFESESVGCKTFFKNNRKQIQKLLVKTLASTAITNKSSRLRCLNYLIKAQPVLTHESSLIRSVVPEAVLCCKDINGKCRAAAFAILNTIGETLASHNQLQDYLNMIIAGLVGTTQIMSATILALSSILYNFSGALGRENIEFLLENVGNVMSTPTREVVGACLSFIKMYCTSLPSPVVAASLPFLVKSICSMTDDCKRNFRIKVRDILDRLVRKYGCDAIIPHVPTTDTVMFKRLRNLRKLNARKKRQKESKNGESESEDEFAVKSKPKSIEEILADSDIEDSDVEETPQKGKKQKSAWIKEDADTIVDFNDSTIVNKITATKPHSNAAETIKKQNKNRGFKTAADGRLIIADIDTHDDSDTDKGKLKKFDKLKLDDSDSDDDVDTAETVSNKKRKRSEMGSVKSGFSSIQTSNYKAGGSGIHRPVNKKTKVAGSEYKSKKAGGDVKKKGKLDPYMYLPLQRNLLNKRKKAKITGQFKNIQKAAKVGALKGSKAKKMKQRK
ncbi:hypothetical protein RN001_012599 [Aquatica leii]|uniref:RRP12-like protein n=1 Tax=Aquatica leii TaxID=1421715 RepID=A0AAN7P441_9COLE|nr:hypothetical protein RN001_012599 [Aquatica leii]